MHYTTVPVPLEYNSKVDNEDAIRETLVAWRSVCPEAFPPHQAQLYTKLRSWEHAACLMHVSAFGNNKVCHKPSHLLETCASRTDSSSEHVLTEMPIVLTFPSNVIRTR